MAGQRLETLSICKVWRVSGGLSGPLSVFDTD